MEKPQAHLEQWRVIRVAEGTRHLVGIVHGHKRLREGARIVSSAIVTLADTRAWAETENTLYQLGAAAEGELPAEWAQKVDALLLLAWDTTRVRDE